MNASSILNAARLPARLTTEQTAELLGMHPHEIPILINTRLLVPLGKPKPNAIKVFAAVDVEAFSRDRAKLDRAQLEIQRHWARHNRQSATGELPRSPLRAA